MTTRKSGKENGTGASRKAARTARPTAPEATVATTSPTSKTTPRAGSKDAKRRAPRASLLETLAQVSSGDRTTAVDAAVQSVLHPPGGTKTAAAVSKATNPRRGPADSISGQAPSDTVGDAATYAARNGSSREQDAPAAKPDATASVQAAEAIAPPLPDFELLTRNMGALMEESGKAAAATLAGDDGLKPVRRPEEASEAFLALGQVAEYWLADPGRMLQAQTSLTSQMFKLWTSSLGSFAGTIGRPAPARPEPRSTDKRFADPAWRENPLFDFLRQAYQLGSGWANELVESADGVDAATRDKARFYLRQISSALSPSNFVLTNPELLRETVEQNGANLVRGMAMLSEDIKAGGGELRIRQTDTSKFALGVNMALTPGKVVFRNEIMELLQYSPTTETVFRRPLLIVPPWINKFYILDLNPEKSFIRWAVEQGLTVFVISWVNPDERHAEKDFESYMREGIFAAMDAIEAATGETNVATIGYCVGGTLLAVTLAYMAATKMPPRISSATLFTTQVDFSHAGDLKVFADETQIRAVEAEMDQTGYLQGSKMAQAFNMLRPEDLIWSYVVNNYLKGKEPLPFDLLAWNSDSTRMPAANHSFYLRNCYLENNLTAGRMELAGARLDLGRVTIPIYNLATSEDHIAPARSVFEGSQYFGGPVRYVLAGSGHIAGVVNPPARAKYGYRDGPEAKGDFPAWLDAAVEHPGTWWTDWLAWLSAQAPDKVPAREAGGGSLEILGEAPGDYVRVRA